MSKKRILIVVDMQNDFISGSLGSDMAKAIVSNVADKIAKYNRQEDLVICTQDTHYDDYLSTHEGKFLPVSHCIEGTSGWDIAEEIEDALPLNAVFIEKSAFGSLPLVNTLLENADETTVFELVGLCTDICVVANAIIVRTAFSENDVVVDSSCCAGTSEENHEAALKTMRSCHIKVI